ncbi:MAG: sigma-54-dependent Fis family transcriptional regulator [Gemmatimonadetes bacterium]|nr:sigma-54-dependent Fis family transcriptional regulator [Gemmatimonadota bacterium]
MPGEPLYDPVPPAPPPGVASAPITTAVARDGGVRPLYGGLRAHVKASDQRLSEDGKERPTQQAAFRAVIGQSEVIQETIAVAYKVARSRIRTVLMEGETGTGKELFARGIHYAGATAAEPFVAVNCAAIPATLLESELFGHERGAFTDASTQKRGLLELAAAGTVLLDEITELSASLQAKLLRAIEERRLRRLGGIQETEIKCRIIAATNTPLEDAVARGSFREDLYYRLEAFRIALPPLRERGADLELLTRHFLEDLPREQGDAAKQVTPEALAVLHTHRWPGNVRELKNVIDRAAFLCDGPEIGSDHILVQRRTSVSGVSITDIQRMIRIPRDGMSLKDVEREAIRVMLHICGGNQTMTARVLGISRPTLSRKLQQYGLVDRGPSAGAVPH